MSFDRWRTKGLAHLVDAKSEVPQGRIWTQLRNGNAPQPMTPFVKTQDDIPSCANAV